MVVIITTQNDEKTGRKKKTGIWGGTWHTVVHTKVIRCLPGIC